MSIDHLFESPQVRKEWNQDSLDDLAANIIGRDVAEALSSYPIPVLQTAICQRVAFAESATQGLTVYEIDPDMLAAQEMNQLADEVEGMLA